MGDGVGMTAIRRPYGRLSAPMRWPVTAAEIDQGDRVLDIGCGFGQDVLGLRALNVNALGWDPDPSNRWQDCALPWCDFSTRCPYPLGYFDVVTLIYVENVLRAGSRELAVEAAKKFLLPGGCLYSAVRTDLKQESSTQYLVPPKEGVGWIVAVQGGSFRIDEWSEPAVRRCSRCGALASEDGTLGLCFDCSVKGRFRV